MALAVYINTAAPTLSWQNGGDDGGDLAVAAASLSVAHPTGYPLYVLAGWAWLHLLPMGDAAYRLNLFSGACTAAAVAAAAWAASELILALRPGLSRNAVAAAAAAAALLLGFSEPVWGQAVVVSVYSLNLAFGSSLLALLLRGQRLGPSSRGSLAFGAILGLGLGNHVTLAFVGLAALAVALIERWPLKLWLPAILGIVVLLPASYSYLVLGGVARRDPVGAWGDPSTAAGFMQLVSAKPYQGLVGRVPLPEIGQRLLRTARLLTEVFTPLGLLAAAAGITQAAAPSPPASSKPLLGPLALAVLACGFSVTYGAARGEHHLLLMYLALTPLVALGLADAMAMLSTRRSWRAIGAPSSVICLAVLVGASAWLSSGASARTDGDAVQFARLDLEKQPINGEVNPQTDADTFALWYAQQVLHIRPDVAVVHLGLWQTSASYREKLLARHPWLSTSLPK